MATARRLQPPIAGERRTWPRYEVGRNIPVTLTADGCRFQARIEDISLGGVRLGLDDAPPRSIEVRVEHAAAGCIYGTRSWRGDTAIGLAFDFSPGALDLVLHCLGMDTAPGGVASEPQAGPA